MDEGFICCYSDVLFTPNVVARLRVNAEDMALVVDTHWLDRYGERTEHPTDDAEKVVVRDGVITRIHRGVPAAEAHGEYIGVAQFTARGAARLRRHFHRCREQYAGRPFREAKVFEMAYLIQFFQDMIEAGERFAPVDTPGGYIEVDTQQDFDYARRHWAGLAGGTGA
jgi:phosphoenolpyruvate phosphomutase